MQRSEVRLVLLQARNQGDPARLSERGSFAAQLEVQPSQLRTIDVLTEPLHLGKLDGAHGLLVGGSGEYSVLDDHPGIRRFIAFLAEVVDSGFPTFASCFGFQAMVQGMGGEVIHDERNAEVGSYPLSKLPVANDDLLFRELPDSFIGQLGHKDRALRLPAGVTNLAQSPACPYQALRVDGKPVYATQFHPELTGQDNRRRFENYMDHYGHLFGAELAQRKLEEYQESPESNRLLARFVDLYLMR